MSDDLLLLAIEQNAQALSSLRANSPLHAAIVVREDVGADPFDSLPVGLAEYIRVSIGAVEAVQNHPMCVSAHGPTYGSVIFADPMIPRVQREAAFRAFLSLAHRMSGLVRALPSRILARLGIHSTFGMPMDDWVWVLFHLAWHFPDHFAGGVARRERLLQRKEGAFVAPEEWMQLGGLTGEFPDSHSGLIFSRFPHELDLVTATGFAIDLLRHALRGGTALEITDTIREQFLRLHQDFRVLGTHFENHPVPDGGSELRILRLDSSFRTPPASQWAGYQVGGAIQANLFLGRLNSAKEVCVLRGGSVNDFVRRANEAGSLLPAWPSPSAAPLLEDARTWLSRLRRRRELQSEQFSVLTPDEKPPHGRSIPKAQILQHHWESTRMPASCSSMVTDHRGNVERWIGFILYMLKEFHPDSVEIREVPTEPAGHGWNAMLTLRTLNIYQASARALELAGLVSTPSSDDNEHARSAVSSRPRTGVPQMCFDDPWEEHAYPPPGAGRYIRVHRGNRASSGEPESQPAWTWTERPEDGWVECGECESESGRVPIARGRPPELCNWLPSDWPARFFPLGSTVAHCAGWRGFVRSVLGPGPDTIPPDDSEYGWRTLTRATRQFAHHLDVIPLERLVAPLPASRGEARREVEPLLDGLVHVRRRADTPLSAESDAPDGVRHVSVTELQSAQQQSLYHGMATLDTIQVGIEPDDVVQVTGLSCKVISGTTPTACPHADPILPPSLLPMAEQAIRRLYPLPAGTTIHWLGHNTGIRSRCRCAEYRDAPFAAPFDQERWANVHKTPTEPPPAPPPVREVPAWEATARRLMFLGKVCKQFRKPAPDQETILAAFQEDGWPDAIDAPLPGSKLARTVESLNDRLQHVKFGLNGAGTGVCWQPI